MKYLIVYSDNESEIIDAKSYEAATKTANKNAATRQRTYKVIEEIQDPEK